MILMNMIVAGLWDNEDVRRWGRDFEDMRLWGHATLRTDDFEDKYYKVFWGQKFCPQSRIKMRLWGQTFKNWQDLQKKSKNIKKYWIYDANTLGIYVIWRVSGRPSGAGLEKVCNFEGFCLGNVHILLDICCQNLGIYVIWRVSGRPSGAGLGNVHFWTFFY